MGLVLDRQDAFTSIFGSLAGSSKLRNDSEYTKAVEELADIVYKTHEKRMGNIIHVLYLGAGASRVYEHKGVLHLWPEGNTRWLSAWGEKITFACGETARIRPKDKVITNLWTRIINWKEKAWPYADEKNRCPGCEMKAHLIPELTTVDGTIDGSLNVELTTDEIRDLKEAYFERLMEALSFSRDNFTSKNVRSAYFQAYAEQALKEVFLSFAVPRAHIRQEYIIGRLAAATWMRDHKTTIESRLGAPWWRDMIEKLWDKPAAEGMGKTQKAFWYSLDPKIRVAKFKLNY